MATARGTKKPVAKTANVEEDVVVPVEKPVVKERRKFNPSDMIACRSITYGELLLPANKSGMLYRWADYGDITEVEFQDLQALRSMRSQYINAPMFIIMDDDILEQWTELNGLYAKIYEVDADQLFNLPMNQFKQQLIDAPAQYKETIKNMASAKILDGTLDSLAKINAIDSILGTDLKFFIQQ